MLINILIMDDTLVITVTAAQFKVSEFVQKF